MNKTHYLSVPFLPNDLEVLEIGDLVFLSGEIIVTVGLPTHKSNILIPRKVHGG